MADKEELIKFLRHIGEDAVPDDAIAWVECTSQGKDDESCAEHGDCGICRFEYMKKKGWLNPSFC